MKDDQAEALEQAARAIENSDAILFTAGAGLGVDSGLPDFRGNQGFWNAYPVFAKLNLSFIDLANPSWFENDPKLAWGFYGHRLNQYRSTIPHQGFDLMRDWAKSKIGGCFAVTSNVDGQFQQAQFDPEFIYEIHGSIHHWQCLKCNHLMKANPKEINVDLESMTSLSDLPSCEKCRTLVRPNILMFNDSNWQPEPYYKQASRYSRWLSSIFDKKLQLVIIEIGAGTSLPSIRNESEKNARQFNAPLIRINLREAAISNFVKKPISISAGALESLKQIDSIMQKN